MPVIAVAPQFCGPNETVLPVGGAAVTSGAAPDPPAPALLPPAPALLPPAPALLPPAPLPLAPPVPAPAPAVPPDPLAPPDPPALFDEPQAEIATAEAASTQSRHQVFFIPTYLLVEVDTACHAEAGAWRAVGKQVLVQHSSGLRATIYHSPGSSPSRGITATRPRPSR
jgi:hypothetical protein